MQADTRAQEPTAPTSSLVGELRRLVPARPLRPSEATVLTEAQARTVHRLAALPGPPVPSQLVWALPKCTVLPLLDMPDDISGATFWNGAEWIMALNGTQSHRRLRFTTWHELKHIVDYPHEANLFGHLQPGAAASLRERLADYFAGLVLMPKAWLTTAFFDGLSLSELAQLFDVSERAIEVRLFQLGLRELIEPEPSRYRPPTPPSLLRQGALRGALV